MNEQLIKVLEQLREYTEMQSKRIDLLLKRLERLERIKWSIVKDRSVIHIKPRIEYEDQKALSIMKLEEERI